MSILNRNEIRRLEKAAKSKDKTKLKEWAEQFENQIILALDKVYNQEIQNSIDNMLIAILYSLYYSEETYIKKENIAEFMNDLFVTIDLYRTGEYTANEFKQQLEKVGVLLTNTYDYNYIYKKYTDILDNDLVNFLKQKHRKIITICGNNKYTDIILEKQKELTLQGNMVFTNGCLSNTDDLDDADKSNLNKLQKDEILISDVVYIINVDGEVGVATKSKIEFAKEHNKEIVYMCEPKDKEVK